VSAATSISEASETANSATEASATPICTSPPAPTAAYNSPIYAGMTMNLTASTIAGATYNWSGPNGFTSADQNPSITNVTATATGTYNVSATVGGCTSTPGTVSVTVNPPASMSIQTSAGSVVLDWPFGTLQSATNVIGPWSNIMDALPPYTNTSTEPQEFFRIWLQ
jgi:hypothetical protein